MLTPFQHEYLLEDLSLTASFSQVDYLGYLDYNQGGWWKQWTQVLCVLTNVGLLGFRRDSKLMVEVFVPVIDATLV